MRTVHNPASRGLPGYLERVDGGVVVHPAKASPPWSGLCGVAVLVVFATVSAAERWSWRVAVPAVAALVGGVALIVVVPPLLVWLRRRRGVIQVRDIRAVAGAETGVAVLAAIAVVAAGVGAALGDIEAGSAYATIPGYAVAVVGLVVGFCCGGTAAWLLTVASAIDAGGPPATGAGLAHVLPLALLGPAAAVVWSAPLVAAVTYEGPTYARLAGLSVALLPLWGGAAWWPSLNQVWRARVTARRARGVGLSYLVGGAVTGALFAVCMFGFGLVEAADEVAEKVIAGLIFGPSFGALLAVPGWALLRYARRLPQV